MSLRNADSLQAIARYMLAEFGARAFDTMWRRATDHILADEKEGALLWSEVARAVGHLQRPMRRLPTVAGASDLGRGTLRPVNLKERMAEQHVRDADRRVTGQQALVAQLGRLRVPADPTLGQRLLATLKVSADLAREHRRLMAARAAP